MCAPHSVESILSTRVEEPPPGFKAIAPSRGSRLAGCTAGQSVGPASHPQGLGALQPRLPRHALGRGVEPGWGPPLLLLSTNARDASQGCTLLASPALCEECATHAPRGPQQFPPPPLPSLVLLAESLAHCPLFLAQDFVADHSDPNIDFAATHIWPGGRAGGGQHPAFLQSK